MASSSNVGFVSSPWGKLPRSPVQSTKSSQLDVSFRDIMDEQQRESSQERDFDEYIQNSYVTVMTPPPSSASTASGVEDETPEVERSFLQLEDLDTDLKLVMSFYEDQDFDDASYEISEQDLDELEDDESEKYYEGLAKKLSTVVELQAGSGKGNKGSRTKNSASLPADNMRLASPSVDNFVDTKSKVMLDKLRQKGVLKGALKPIHVDNSFTVFHATGGMLKRRDGTSLLNTSLSSSSTCSILKLRLPKECYVKVFKNDKTETTTSMEDEQRIINAKKEVAHLNRMTRAGIPCPQVQFLLGHILVTDFLGKDGSPAKKLKEAHDLVNSRSALKSAYEQITNNIKTLFKTCHLVLEDLSNSNIVWYKRQAYFVNPVNALNSNRVEALELLYHECVSITEFFEKKGKSDCRTPQELFQWITGFDFTGQHVDYNTEQDFAIV